ncbi:hypothetical protein OIU78_005776 [Salix suchowensis]|nr:hypothetical protein OIU78_005776 [Salix suchowensis]
MPHTISTKIRTYNFTSNNPDPAKLTKSFHTLDIHLRTGKLGNSLGPFRNSMFRKLSRQDQSDSGLDLPRGNGGLLVVPRKPRRLLSELLKDIVDETVHDTHCLAGDPNVRMDLFQDLKDIDLVGEEVSVDWLDLRRRGLLTWWDDLWGFK